jgi:periplasmic divalent cation tolerance protein
MTPVKSGSFSIILTTCPDKKMAKKIARALVSSRAAACVNIVPGVLSIYRWEGEVQEEPEVLLLVKTRAEQASRVQEIILENHGYEVPEVVVVPIVSGWEKYLDWLAQESG